MCYVNSHIYSTLFKTQERESDRRSKEIEQRKESQKTHIQTKQQGHMTLIAELHVRFSFKVENYSWDNINSNLYCFAARGALIWLTRGSTEFLLLRMYSFD